MIIERFMNPALLSNSYLVAGQPGGTALLIDSGAPSKPVLARIREFDLRVTHLLCTHHHGDHTENNLAYQARFACHVGGHDSERKMIPGCDLSLADGDTLEVGALTIRVLHVPGHTLGQLAFVVGDQTSSASVFTGDTLFRRSVGGTRAQGHTTFADLRHSVMKVLGRLPPESRVHPGHAEPTTIAEEWQKNPFIRAWRGVDRPNPRPCLAYDQPAALMVLARDYDGGTKCWVRFAKGGVDDVVPGSRVTLEE